MIHQRRCGAIPPELLIGWLAVWAALGLASVGSSGAVPPQAAIPAHSLFLTCVAPASTGAGPSAAAPPCPAPDPIPGPPVSLAQCPPGPQFASCLETLTTLTGWTRWVLLAIGAAGVLSVLATFYQVIGATGGRGTTDAWRLLFHRLMSASIVFFVAWRLTPLATLVETTLAAHTSETTTGNAPLPAGALGALVGMLFGILLQGVLAWLMLRLVLRVVEGVAAIGGHDPRALSTTLRAVGGFVLLGLLTLATPSFIGWLARLLTTGAF